MSISLRTVGFIGLSLLLLTLLSLATWDTPLAAQTAGRQLLAQTQGERSLSTPRLIEAALTRGEIDEESAALYLAYAFAAYDKLPERFHSDVPWHGTLPMKQLRDSLAQMPASPTRAAIEALLTGRCGDSSVPLANLFDSTHFHIEYGAIAGGLTLEDYVTSLETTWGTEVDSFGWAAPPVLSSNPPPGNRYHVRIDNLPGGLYGYVTSSGVHAGFVGDNPNTTWNDGDAYASCMVLNQDYGSFPGSAQQALDATTAHEFNHSIQFGYGALVGANSADDAFTEGGATWMEDEVFDSANDNYNYLWPDFDICMGEYAQSPYPYWITFRGITEQYGSGTGGGGEQIMQDFWEATSQGTASNLGALDEALAARSSNLADAFHTYAIAAKFNKTCGGDYGYPYCFEEAANYVASAGATTVQGSIGTVGGSRDGVIQENYALNWVQMPASGGPYRVTLQNTAGSGGALRTSLVCDTGSTLHVYALPSVVGAGASSTLSYFDPSGCSSVVAVITNQAQTADNPSSCASTSYRLSTDASTVELSESLNLPLVMKALPSVPTPTPSPTPLPEPSPTPSPTPAPVDPIINGNFESGPTAWVEYSAYGYPLIVDDFQDNTIVPYSGTWAAWLGGAPDELSIISQQVTISPSAPYLGYWYWIGSEEPSCESEPDLGGVVINDVVMDLYPLCAGAETNGWVKRVINLSAYAGQNVNLQLIASLDGDDLNSNLFLDDVAFQSTPGGNGERQSAAPALQETVRAARR